jgi:glycosyl transferase family 1
VIAAMSEGRVNIMTQRPLFRRLKLLTSKFFEIFCADTIPLVMLDPDHAELVYGPAGRELALHGDIADKLLDALSRPKKYRELVQTVRQHLVAHHSYRKRMEELVVALKARTSPNRGAELGVAAHLEVRLL